MKGIPRGRYTKEFRQEAVKLVTEEKLSWSEDRVIPPYLLFQRWMVAGETPCFRAASTTGHPASTSCRTRNICTSEYLLVFTFASSCSYFTGVSHFKWPYFRGAGQAWLKKQVIKRIQSLKIIRRSPQDD